jgi:hypothetical protein
MEAAGDVSKLDTRKDTKGRRQPARKPERRKVPIESQKQAARQVVKHMAAANAESEVNEVARLRARMQELETEIHQLKHKNLALQSEVDELRARLEDAPSVRAAISSSAISRTAPCPPTLARTAKRRRSGTTSRDRAAVLPGCRRKRPILPASDWSSCGCDGERT